MRGSTRKSPANAIEVEFMSPTATLWILTEFPFVPIKSTLYCKYIGIKTKYERGTKMSSKVFATIKTCSKTNCHSFILP